jgi:NADH:ubiquinone oxidoreductase subunit E
MIDIVEDDKKKDKDDKEKEKKKEKRKYLTVKPDLLLACIYFDQNHCGYILDKDMEEIMHAIGLSLSRAQVSQAL